MKQSIADRLAAAEKMANDFLTVHRECTYDNKTDEERKNMERIAKQARLVTAYTGDYNPKDDSKDFLGGGC